MNIERAKEILGGSFAENAEVINPIVSQLGLQKAVKVLDVGTGLGHMSIILAVNGFIVTTGQPNADHWGDWQSNMERVGVSNQITFKEFFAEQLPFENGEFDAVFLHASFHHVEDKDAAIRECLRVMKVRGTLVFFELNEKGVAHTRETYPNHPDVVDPRDYMKKPAMNIQVIKLDELDAFIVKRVD